jgi:hypothetical protein
VLIDGQKNKYSVDSVIKETVNLVHPTVLLSFSGQDKSCFILVQNDRLQKHGHC